jgi:hypothetical protein
MSAAAKWPVLPLALRAAGNQDRGDCVGLEETLARVGEIIGQISTRPGPSARTVSATRITVVNKGYRHK